jgi:hypothetical protein
VNVYISRLLHVVRNAIFRKAPPSVVSGYGKRSINLNKVVATFEFVTMEQKIKVAVET